MNVWLIPSSREWQAKQWRRVCGVTPSGRPSFRAWPLTNSSTASGVSGASLTVLGNSHPLGRPYRYDLQVTVTEYGIPVLPVQASVKMKKAALDKLNNSKQDPLPIQADDKNWNADQNLMDWLNGFGILGSIPIHILQSETLE